MTNGQDDEPDSCPSVSIRHQLPYSPICHRIKWNSYAAPFRHLKYYITLGFISRSPLLDKMKMDSVKRLRDLSLFPHIDHLVCPEYQ
ncbi:hypothetical protein J6590_085988 [Homalodisca vitripennis]|nr:hypothetical protein J6590_085988 [Homalodisca vitripennis]